MRLLVNDLRSVIAEPIELMRDLVEVLLPNNYSNQFFTADPKSSALDHLCRPFRVRKRIERQFHFGAWSLEPGASIGGRDHRDQRSCHRNFMNAVFGQRNANR